MGVLILQRKVIWGWTHFVKEKKSIGVIVIQKKSTLNTSVTTRTLLFPLYYRKVILEMDTFVKIQWESLYCREK
jgi:hypothetical protein